MDNNGQQSAVLHASLMRFSSSHHRNVNLWIIDLSRMNANGRHWSIRNNVRKLRCWISTVFYLFVGESRARLTQKGEERVQILAPGSHHHHQLHHQHQLLQPQAAWIHLQPNLNQFFTLLRNPGPRSAEWCTNSHRPFQEYIFGCNHFLPKTLSGTLFKHFHPFLCHLWPLWQ